jgi:G:T/U-mismatch repair DNA glycosylase
MGICDIVESCERKKMDASDLGMSAIELRDLMFYINKNTKVQTLLLTGGSSKNGPEYHLRRQLKEKNITFKLISAETPKIHEFEFIEDETIRKIKVISLTAPSGSANRAVGSNPQYQFLKKQNPKFNTFDFRVLQYKKFF